MTFWCATEGAMTDVATTMLEESVYLRECCRFEEAEKAAKEGLAIRKDLLGENHPGYPLALFRVAECLYSAGEMKQAITLAAEASDRLEILMGAEGVKESSPASEKAKKTKGDATKAETSEPHLDELMVGLLNDTSTRLRAMGCRGVAR